MPTFEGRPEFLADFRRLTPDQQARFRSAVTKFVADLRSGALRPGLRVKSVEGYASIFELTWADDGRATFQYGSPRRPGEPHIVWRRIGSHDIFRRP